MMKRLTAITLSISLGLMLASSLALAAAKNENIQFTKSKNGLLMSAGVIALVKTEGEIALDDERITCQRTQRTGSHLNETFCLTHEEAEVARRRNQQTMWRYLQGVKR